MSHPVDPTYVSPGDALFDGSAVLYYGLVLVELFLLPLRRNFAWKGSASAVTNHFWRAQ